MGEQAVGKFEKVASGVYLEGLAVAYERNVIWYSDIIAGGIHGVRPDGSKVQPFNEGRMWTGGVMMSGDGSVLSTGQGGTMWNNEFSSRYVTFLAVDRPNDDNYQGSFAKVDLGLTLRAPNKRWELALIGKNINDRVISGNCNSAPLLTGAVLAT